MLLRARAGRTSARHRRTPRRQKCTASPAREVLVFDGDGVGPEIITAARRVADAALSVAGVRGIRWIEMDGYGYDNGLGVTEAHLEAFGEVGVLLKGPLSIPAGTSGSVIEARGQAFTSANQALRRLFGLYANVRPARSYALPWPTRFGDVAVDLLIVRENTEDLYCGAPEVWVDKDTCQATKRISRGASARIAEYACALALQRQAERGAPSLVTAVHKANVCKQSDGLFLEEARKAASAAGLRYEEALVDSLCAGLVLQPQAYDVLVAPNCWGDIVSDLAGGVVGSLGLLGSANVGASHALFEAAHGSAPDIAGRGVANPASMMLSAAMLMRHVGEAPAADAVERAIAAALAEGCATVDLGGAASTGDFTDAVIAEIEQSGADSLCLRHAKIPYTDLSPTDYFDVGWRDGAKDATPFGQLPLLLVDDEPPLAQSGAITRYVAGLCALTPSDPLAAARCDAIYEAAQELMTAPTNVNPIVNVFKGDTFTQKRTEYFELAPPKIANLARALGAGPFFFGAKPLYCDFAVYHVLSNTLLLEPTVLDARDNLKSFVAAVEALPGIAEYLEERPEPVDIGVAPMLRPKAK